MGTGRGDTNVISHFPKFLALISHIPLFFSLPHDDIPLYQCYRDKLPRCSNLLFCGDINGYTGCLPDYCIEDNYDRLTNEADFYIPYVQDVPLARNNLDFRPTNPRGDNFLDLCKGCNVRILNGRFLGDTLGN